MDPPPRFRAWRGLTRRRPFRSEGPRPGTGQRGGLEGASTLRPETWKTAWGGRLRPPPRPAAATGVKGRGPPGGPVPIDPPSNAPGPLERRKGPEACTRPPVLRKDDRSYGGRRRRARAGPRARGRARRPPQRHGRGMAATAGPGCPAGGASPSASTRGRRGLSGSRTGPWAWGAGRRARLPGGGRPPGTLARRARRREGRWRGRLRLQDTGPRGPKPVPRGLGAGIPGPDAPAAMAEGWERPSAPDRTFPLPFGPAGGEGHGEGGVHGHDPVAPRTCLPKGARGPPRSGLREVKFRVEDDPPGLVEWGPSANHHGLGCGLRGSLIRFDAHTFAM